MEALLLTLGVILLMVGTLVLLAGPGRARRGSAGSGRPWGGARGGGRLRHGRRRPRGRRCALALVRPRFGRGRATLISPEGEPAFEVLGPRPRARPIVGHVPHASLHIPPGERGGILLDDAALAAELLRLTDAHTDRLFAWIRDLGGTLLVNRVSRLVVDPERFPDDAARADGAGGAGGRVHADDRRGAAPGDRRRRSAPGSWHAGTSPTTPPSRASSRRRSTRSGRAW